MLNDNLKSHNLTIATFKILQDHIDALYHVTAEEAALRERIDALEKVLINLKAGYNPNYQDMAVLEAVRGWDQLKPAEEEASPEGTEESYVSEEEQVWTEEHINELKSTDPLSVLLEHERHVGGPASDEISGVRECQCWMTKLKIPHCLIT